MGYIELLPAQPSNWTFPPPLPQDFLTSYYTTLPANDSTSHPTDLLIASLTNVTKNRGYGFGAGMIEVKVGDVVQPEWKGDANRSVSLNCVVCSQGRGRGTIFEACSGYTDTAHTSPLYDATPIQPSQSSYTLPTLSRTFELSSSAVGVCFFMLSSPQGMATIDYSIPFPVTQATRLPPYRFNSTVPTGSGDWSIASHTPTHTPVLQNPQKEHGGGRKLDVQDIVGIVVGVVGCVSVVLLGAWLFWWRKRKSRPKVMDEGESEADVGATELQRVQPGGVERRVERDEGGDAPPAYHEVVQGNERPQGRAQGPR